jgi:ABC-2 type transport system ATP-binding protein
VVSVRELRKSYPQQTTPAVDGVSFDVGAGRICALLGGNGAGKTTTMRVLTYARAT